MSTPQSLDAIDDDIAAAFRRSNRVPLILALLMLLAVVTIGTKLFMDWRARQVDQVFPPGTVAQSETAGEAAPPVHAPGAATDTSGAAPTVSPLPVGQALTEGSDAQTSPAVAARQTALTSRALPAGLR